MRKVLVAVGSVVLTGIVALAVWVLATALQSEHRVGFQTVMVADPNGPPIEVGIWYPTDARPRPKLTGLIVQWVAGDAPVKGTHHPLIVISHGIAGALSSHADTALALADAGFVVAAPLHTGDNYRDQSAIGTTAWYPDRVRHVHLTINYMLEQWRERGRIDANKVGVFGFSAGGATALIAIGGMPDFDRIKEHCAKVQEFACDIWHKTKAPPPDWRDFLHDPRIKSAVVIAPGAGFAFAQYGLTNVRVPVQLWGGDHDESVPTPSNAEIVHRALGQRAEWHLVPKAGHFSFMVPCGPAALIAPKMICEDAAGFDRAAFHKSFNAEVVAYFRKTLAEAEPLVCSTGWRYKICVPSNRVRAVEISGQLGARDIFGHPIKTGPLFTGRGLLVAIGLQDYIFDFATDDLERVCSAHWCLYYQKEWFKPLHIARYNFYQTVPKNQADTIKRVTNGEALQLRADTVEDFLAAEHAVRIGMPGDPTTEFIPLAALDKLSTKTPRVCDPRFPVSECHKPMPWNFTRP